ncbi:hypothetical protein Daus18300_009245 [Diaporthe australafricana]|uniref:Uncharacterized protein n=1 Tax=Diaporthe australafricana TaxID=127596 RepID=A0ABR3WF20_9PEZI
MSQPQTGTSAKGQTDKSRDAPANTMSQSQTSQDKEVIDRQEQELAKYQPPGTSAKAQTDKSPDAPGKTWEQAAALLIGGTNGQILGDKSLVGGDLRVMVGSYKPPYQPSLDPWLGFRIEIPRADPAATEEAGFGVCYMLDYNNESPAPKTATSLVIRVKFADPQVNVTEGVGDLVNRTGGLAKKLQPQTVSRVRFFLRGPPVIEGFGLPFSNPGHPSEGWLFRDEPIVDGKTFSSIFAQDEFEFIVPRVTATMLKSRLSLKELGPVFDYPWGTEQNWDASFRLAAAPEIAGPAFHPTFSFPDDESSTAVLAQSVFQDFYWLWEASKTIQDMPFAVYFVPVGEDEELHVFYVIVDLPKDYQTGFENAWRFFLRKGSLKLRINDLDFAPAESGSTWEARVMDAAPGIDKLHVHGVMSDDRLVLLARRPASQEWKAFEPKQFKSADVAREALKQGSAH